MSFRPTFYYNNNSNNPIRAAGILIITSDMYGRELYLLNHCNGKYEDIGGKSDAVDHSAVDTAVRECCEECNYNLFGIERSKDCKEMSYQHLFNYRTQEIYNRKSKYLLFKVYVDPTILNLNMKRFKLTEKVEWGVLNHYFQWKLRIPTKLHPRLLTIKNFL